MDDPAAEASLRRAISTAYYALFHFLVECATERVSERPELGERLRRCFDHGDMKLASKAFSELADKARALVAEPIPDEIRLAAKIFVELQEERHLADYDFAWKPHNLPLRAIVCVSMAQRAFDAWDRVERHPAAEAYLIALLAWGKIGKR